MNSKTILGPWNVIVDESWKNSDSLAVESRGYHADPSAHICVPGSKEGQEGLITLINTVIC